MALLGGVGGGVGTSPCGMAGANSSSKLGAASGALICGGVGTMVLTVARGGAATDPTTTRTAD